VSEQLALFESASPEPQGLRYAADFVSPETEQKFISGIRELPLQPFQFGQFEGKRRVASFGFRCGSLSETQIRLASEDVILLDETWKGDEIAPKTTLVF
jgi:hypothetical protein